MLFLKDKILYFNFHFFNFSTLTKRHTTARDTRRKKKAVFLC